jgi:hypothetical protein
MLRWRGSTAYAQVSHLAGLYVAQGLLEVVDVAGGFANLRVDTRADGGIVGRLGHLAGSINDGIFAVDFADELLDGGLIVVAHDGGCGGRSHEVAESGRWMICRVECRGRVWRVGGQVLVVLLLFGVDVACRLVRSGRHVLDPQLRWWERFVGGDGVEMSKDG